ncbi:MAG: hypothetical protein ACT4ON_15235 [Bacteroidota bacterium]
MKLTRFFKLGLLVIIPIVNCTISTKAQEKCDCPTQSKVGKGSLYFAWGYNKDWFSKSDIHFKNTTGEHNTVTENGDYYDFTVYDAQAKDRPGFNTILTSPLSVPQYVYRLGYYFNDKYDLGIEINFDHVKYIVRDWQTLRVKGHINGQEIDKDTLINPDSFLHFEHTDGANFLMLNLMKRQRLLVSNNKKHWVSGIVKAGAGIVIPKTYVKLFGQEMDNRFHVAGYCAGIEAGLRYDAFKYVFLEYTGKGVFADYMDVLAIGAGKINHRFWTFENILVLGLQIPF